MYIKIKKKGKKYVDMQTLTYLKVWQRDACYGCRNIRYRMQYSVMNIRSAIGRNDGAVYVCRT
jgi:hypothetical protein